LLLHEATADKFWLARAERRWDELVQGDFINPTMPEWPVPVERLASMGFSPPKREQRLRKCCFVIRRDE